jgi:glutathione synthase
MSQALDTPSVRAIKIGVVMDPISALNYKKDTTLALLWAAQARGWQLFYMEQQDLLLDQGRACARMAGLQVFRSPERWFELAEAGIAPLSGLDVILMRKDPPFDVNYIYSTYILEAAEQEGVLVLNKPRSLRDCNEKIFATRFPQCCPPVLVTSQAAAIRAFAETQGDIILKPLDGMGGQGVFRIDRGDPNLSVVIETLSGHGTRPIMAQRFLPEISQGDKRILMINGEAVPYCLARIPRQGEARGNLAAGGHGEVRALTDRDRWIAAQVAPALKEKGLWFVGLDVIGDFLTEINVTSPTCLREIEAATSLNIAELFIHAIDQQLRDAK